MNHQPLGRIEGDRVRLGDALQPDAKLRTDECTAGIGGVHVQPEFVLQAYVTHLGQVVEGARPGGSQGGADLE